MLMCVLAKVKIVPSLLEDLSKTLEMTREILNRRELSIKPETGQSDMLMVEGELSDLLLGLKEAFQQVCEGGRAAMTVTFCDPCPFNRWKKDDEITFFPIGRVENEFKEVAPPEEIKAVESRVIIDPGLIRGLQGLEPGQRVLVVFYFDRSEDCELLQHPRRDQNRPKRGVFALCSPHRPNPIGVTVVELIDIQGNVLRVRGLDAIDNTPVLDLKPA